MRRLPVLVGLLALATMGLAAGCGDDDEQPASEPATTAASEPTGVEEPATTEATTGEAAITGATTGEEPSTAAADALPVAIYLVRGEKVSPVRRHVDRAAPAAPALEALFAGPAAEDGDRSTAIPEGTRLLGVDLDDAGILTADLSEEFGSGGGTLSMRLRLAQVVYTATQFPTVKGVRFAIEGTPIDTLGGEGIVIDQPQTRGDYEDETPLILIEQPLPGDEVSCPVPASGTSNVFEANSLMGITTIDGELPGDPTIVTATSGTGTRGTFEVEVDCGDVTGGAAFVASWLESAKDGSPQEVEHVPVELR